METLKTLEAVKANGSNRKKRYSKRKSKKRPGRLERKKISLRAKEALIEELKCTELKLREAVTKVVKQNKSLKK